jgi:hypothetical protein
MTLAQARKLTAGVGLASLLCWLWLALLTVLQLGLRLPPLG